MTKATPVANLASASRSERAFGAGAAWAGAASAISVQRRFFAESELSDLGGEPWVGGAPTSAWHRIVGHACRLAGFAPQVGFASDDYIAIQALVAAGLGVAVIPGLAVAHPLPGLEVRTLGSGAPLRHISGARPRDAYHGPAVTAMLDSLRATAQALAVTADRHDRN